MLVKPTLFIDFDGTLCYDRFWRSLDFDLREKVQSFFSKSNELISDWMIGKYTSEEINLKIAKEINIDYNILWPIFVNDCKNMFIPKDTLIKIQNLRNRYFVVLTTDNMDSLNRFTIPSLSLDKYFDLIINSYNEQRLKNDDNGKTFQKIIEKYQSPLSESILIDNSVATCKIFENLGGRSLLVTPEKPLVDWLEVL